MKTPIITEADFKRCAQQIIDEAKASASDSNQEPMSDFFGFADDSVISALYSKVSGWLYSSYSETEPFEYKIAYSAVTVILDHSLVDGNKRAGVFTMLILLCCAGSPLSISDEGMTTRRLFDIAYHIASAGNAKREESINTLKDIIVRLAQAENP